MIALWLYCRKTKLHYMDVVDMIAVATPITACFIRLANLMNSEIIGNPTDVPWAFVFERVDMLPRHPGQLYEAIAYLILFFIIRITARNCIADSSSDSVWLISLPSVSLSNL